MFNKIRAVIRMLGFVVISAWALLRVTMRHLFSKKNVDKDLEVRKDWASNAMSILGFRVEIEGNHLGKKTCLYVSNHRSSLDPIVILSDLEAYPISRADVRNWPIVGKGADMTGIIFVDKGNRESRVRTKDALLEEMKKGNSILIFPEGRTNVEHSTITFQKGAFDMAAKGNFPVVPIAFEYQYEADYWDHSDNFVVHFLKNFGKRHTPIRMVYGEPLRSDNAWTLLRQSRAWIDNKMDEMNREWGKW